MVHWIDQARTDGARLSKACEVVGVTSRTVERWREDGRVKADGRAAGARGHEPANKLSEAECGRILEVCNQPAFADLAPSQIVPRLADQGLYVGSESSFYRILRKAD